MTIPTNLKNLCAKFEKYARISNRDTKGSMPEWLMGADCKSAGYAYVGSNPTRPIQKIC